MEQILLAYGFLKETAVAIMLLYKNTKAMVCLHDGNTDIFDIVTRVWQEDKLASILFIIQRFWTIVFIFIVIFTTFWSICPPASGVSCQNLKPTQNFEPRPLFNPQELLAQISLTITRYKC